MSFRLRRRYVAVAALLGLLAPSAAAAPAQADGGNNTSQKLRAAVNANGVFQHLYALAAIGRLSDDTRVSGTKGYDRSAAYAEAVLRLAGYQVSKQTFTFKAFRGLEPSVLRQSAPGTPRALEHNILSYSGSGNVSAAASLPTGSPLGCAAADFGAANAGTVVVVGRGTCPFAQKATNAHAAGALAVVVYNNTVGELAGTLGEAFALELPVVGVTQALGQELVGLVPAGLRLDVSTTTFRGDAQTTNIFAESRGGDANNVVMAGAHLDSVWQGPGINDNGTGAASILEIAVQMRKVNPENKVRFALWGAEESGLIGSTKYIEQLPVAEREKIALYLNFDMVGSPNFVRFVYDGDNSAFPPGPGSAVGPPGSGAIERLFHEYFKSVNLASAETPFSGRSDYGPFIAEGVGIPSGGLFTGAEGVKTQAQADVFGGTVGAAYDACYHKACDTIRNVNRSAVDQMVDAISHAVITYANDTSSVNGDNNGSAGPNNPNGATNDGGGGLHDDDHDATE
jgi:Zn-dependent M28 family amino/carboxypeptidase